MVTQRKVPGGRVGGTMTWAAWANAGELERFQKFTTQYAAQRSVNARFRHLPMPPDYLPELLKQLKAGAGLDAFYIFDEDMPQLLDSGAVMPLNDYLASPHAKVKFEMTNPRLSRFCKTSDGQIHGVVVDCNPCVFWFNHKILERAGVGTDPATLFEAGKWNLEALTNLLEKVRSANKIPAVVEPALFTWWGYITSMGGTMLDASGKAVFDTDPKAMTAITWMLEQLRSGNLIYGGALPKGKTVPALFYSGELATITYGRSVLPDLRNRGMIDYCDIAPLASEDGKTIAPVPVATSAMCMNSKSENLDTAFDFLGRFSNADGQLFRLSGRGNAVPTAPDLDYVVTEGNQPKHAGWFTDIVAAGYGIPQLFGTSPTKTAAFRRTVDELLGPDALPSTTPATFAQRLVTILNSR